LSGKHAQFHPGDPAWNNNGTFIRNNQNYVKGSGLENQVLDLHIKIFQPIKKKIQIEKKNI